MMPLQFFRGRAFGWLFNRVLIAPGAIFTHTVDQASTYADIAGAEIILVTKGTIDIVQDDTGVQLPYKSIGEGSLPYQDNAGHLTVYPAGFKITQTSQAGAEAVCFSKQFNLGAVPTVQKVQLQAGETVPEGRLFFLVNGTVQAGNTTLSGISAITNTSGSTITCTTPVLGLLLDRER